MTELEQLNEMFDLKTAKGYEFTELPKEKWVGWVNLTYEATFTIDNGKEFSFRVQRAKEYGNYARRIFLTYKAANKTKASQKLVIDKGTFKKVLVTFMRIYDSYKMSEDGMKSAGYALVMQPGFSQYLPLLHRALQRAFKNQPKKKLSLVGVNEEASGKSIEVFYEVKASPFPAFNGKKFSYIDYISNETYKQLANIKAEDPSPAAVINSEEDVNDIEYEVEEGKPDPDASFAGYYQIKDSSYLIGLTGASSFSILYVKKSLKSYSKAFSDTVFTVAEGDATIYTPDGEVKNNFSFTVYLGDMEYAITSMSSTTANYWINDYKEKKAKQETTDLADKFKAAPKYTIDDLEGVFGFFEVLNGDLIVPMIPDKSVIRIYGSNIKIIGDYFESTKTKIYDSMDGEERYEDISFLISHYKDGAVLKKIDSVDAKHLIDAFTKEEPIAPEDSYVEIQTEEPFDLTKQKGKFVRMTADSGSSKLKASEVAKIVDYGMNGDDFDTALAVYGLPSSTKIDEPFLVVQPVKHIEKHVLLKLSDNGSTYNILDTYDAESDSEVSSKAKNTGVNASNKPVKNDSPVVELSKTQEQLLREYGMEPFKFGPISIDLAGLSIVDLTDKIKEIQSYFPSLDTETLKTMVTKNYERVVNLSENIGNSMHHIIMQHDLEFKGGTKGTSSIKAYSGNAYNNINKYLRFGEDLINGVSGYALEDTKKHIEALDKVFEKHGKKFPADLKVYRGASMTAEEIQILDDGGYYEMTSYSSTSLRPEVAHNFAKVGSYSFVKGATGDQDDISVDTRQGNKVFMEISDLDKCLCLYINEVSEYKNEREMLINRGTIVQAKDKLIKVMNIKQAGDIKGGVWVGRFRVVEALNEMAMPVYMKDFFKLLREQLEPYEDALMNLAILQIGLIGLAEENGFNIE
jgi:hypothetical protein